MENRNENCGFFIYFWGKRINMEKPQTIRQFEALNNISLTENQDSIYNEYASDKIKNVYKLNKEGEVIALNIGGNNLEKIPWIHLFNKLEYLYLHNNEIKDVSFIRSLPNLKIINL